MRGHNSAFARDPFAFVRQRTVNNWAWPVRAVRSGPDLQLFQQLTLTRRGRFDLVETAPGTLRLEAVAGDARGDERWLEAYWCPFRQGWGMPGFVEVPRRNPAFPFVFTTAMMGSALVATDSPQGPGFFRLYHHQSPDDPAVWDPIHGVGMTVLSRAGFETYGVPDSEDGPGTIAFNFLHHRMGRWHYVFQPQYANAACLEVTRVPGAASTEPVF